MTKLATIRETSEQETTDLEGHRQLSLCSRGIQTETENPENQDGTPSPAVHFPTARRTHTASRQTDRRTDERTDGRTDRQTRWNAITGGTLSCSKNTYS